MSCVTSWDSPWSLYPMTWHSSLKSRTRSPLCTPAKLLSKQPRWSCSPIRCTNTLVACSAQCCPSRLAPAVSTRFQALFHHREIFPRETASRHVRLTPDTEKTSLPCALKLDLRKRNTPMQPSQTKRPELSLLALWSRTLDQSRRRKV